MSQRAKPLGHMPYHWGAYLGFTAAWMALILIGSGVLALVGGHLRGGSALCVAAALAAVSSLGILGRRKFGVVAFALMYAALILMAPFLEGVPGQPFLLTVRNQPFSLMELAEQARSLPSLASLLFGAVYFVCTFVYFKKRWRLLPATPN
jgi:hypothetical protein